MNRQQSYLDKLPWDRKLNLNLEALTQKELDILFEDNEDAEQEDHEIEVAESEEHNTEEDDIQRESTQIRNNFIAADGTEWLSVPPVESQRRRLNVMHRKEHVKEKYRLKKGVVPSQNLPKISHPKRIHESLMTQRQNRMERRQNLSEKRNVEMSTDLNRSSESIMIVGEQRIIGNASRSYETTNTLSRIDLQNALSNLRRISSHISDSTLLHLTSVINGLLSLSPREGSTSFHVPEIRNGGRGRPKMIITKEQLKLLYKEGYSAPEMAKILSCSQSLIYKHLHNQEMHLRKRYSSISNEDLETIIKEIHEVHPNCGYEMMAGYLRSRNIHVQRCRIRSILGKTDPLGVAGRWSTTIKRRTYKVPTPNFLWHIDAHLKLSRWGFVIHGCIDGYSRMIIYVKCATSIQAEPVLKFFLDAVNVHGLPSRVRSDHGYENLFVALIMNLIRGVHRGSHITGKSVHNQRIERLWLDVYKEVVSNIQTELYSLEDDGLLDIDNDLHKFCVQYIYLKTINLRLSSFKNAWNEHKIRTERRTPRQLWLSGLLNKYDSDYTVVNEIFKAEALKVSETILNSLTNMNVDTNIINLDAEVPQSCFTVTPSLSAEQTANLDDVLNNLELNDKQKYLRCVNLLCNQN
ncbi:hypothetical protein FQR65_LT16112 [Abscondita terminalis]|nr:hypothetical protein FQR65_LT16112 [Abscondita terminalis]